MSSRIFAHRIPFNSEELLLLAGLSHSVLDDPTVRELAVKLSPDLDGLRARLETFVRFGLAANREIRGNTLVTQVVTELNPGQTSSEQAANCSCIYEQVA